MYFANANFNESTGEIKPLNGVCCAPYAIDGGKNQPMVDKIFKEANISYCRLHDCMGSYGGAHFVDITNVFPDFSKDASDPASYDFHYTDEYVSAIVSAGTEPYFRLGETIEWGSKKYSTLVPPDFNKWAKICEMIVRHYNEGWAEGFHFNIKYWEILNEPENPGNKFGPSMFQGTKEEFFKLYETASKHLRTCFPDIKVGGYGSCGFYEVTREKINESFREFVPYFKSFLAMVRETGSPLDFFSWHIYTDSVDEILTHAQFVRQALDENGFTKTESHLNEWNIGAEGQSFSAKHTMEGASFNAAVISALQNAGTVDLAAYYCLSMSGLYNGFIDQNDHKIDYPFYSFKAFGRLYSLENAVKSECSSEIYSCAAKNEAEGAVMISNYKGAEDSVRLSYNSAPGKEISLYLLSEGLYLKEIFKASVSKDGFIEFVLPERSVALILFK